ncbi:MAG: hypothetical protein HC896_13395 [Bacteroidales bacterium]|nr:hypothetical protein [Bacteroidales bacterium]
MIFKKLTFTVALIAVSCIVYSNVYNVLEYGAVNSNKTISTVAIQKAIDDCSAKGGGQVLFPSGEYLTGSLVLKSNVNIHLQHGAVIYGSPYAKDYVEHEPTFHSSTNVYQTCGLFFWRKH